MSTRVASSVECTMLPTSWLIAPLSLVTLPVKLRSTHLFSRATMAEGERTLKKSPISPIRFAYRP